MSAPGTLDIPGIRARAEAASKDWPAPWKAESEGVQCSAVGTYSTIVASYVDGTAAAHIAGMDPPTTLALVDEMERLDHECQYSMAAIADERARAEKAEAEVERLTRDSCVREVRRVAGLLVAAEAEAAKLRARVAELEGAMGPFARYDVDRLTMSDDGRFIYVVVPFDRYDQPKQTDFTRAKAVLAETRGGGAP